VEDLPFGGVGNSGMGNYHGKAGFDTFSHKRAIVLRKSGFELLNSPRYANASSSQLDFLIAVAGKKLPGAWRMALLHAKRRFPWKFFFAILCVFSAFVLGRRSQ
jgi:hypothetical protein